MRDHLAGGGTDPRRHPRAARPRRRERTAAGGGTRMTCAFAPLFSPARLGLLPPPLAGEGWGGGASGDSRTWDTPLRPLPSPPPQAGEGTQEPHGLRGSSGRHHDRAVGLVHARHAARRARRRRRADRRAVLPDRRDADAVRDRPRPRAAGADRPRHPVAGRAAGEPAGARPPDRHGSGGRLARPDPDGARAAGTRARRQGARALADHRRCRW